MDEKCDQGSPLCFDLKRCRRRVSARGQTKKINKCLFLEPPPRPPNRDFRVNSGSEALANVGFLGPMLDFQDRRPGQFPPRADRSDTNLHLGLAISLTLAWPGRHLHEFAAILTSDLSLEAAQFEKMAWPRPRSELWRPKS